VVWAQQQLVFHSVDILFQSPTTRWYFTLMLNFPIILYFTQFKKNIITIYLLFFIYFDFPRLRSRTPIIPYNIKFFQCGVTERTAVEERIPGVGGGFSSEFEAWKCSAVRCSNCYGSESSPGDEFTVTFHCPAYWGTDASTIVFTILLLLPLQSRLENSDFAVVFLLDTVFMISNTQTEIATS
jgi:hypothetical protein